MIKTSFSQKREKKIEEKENTAKKQKVIYSNPYGKKC